MNKIKQAICLLALFTLTVFLNGSSSKESSSRSLSQIPDHYQSFMHRNKTSIAIKPAQEVWGTYRFELVFDQHLDPFKAVQSPEKFLSFVNDVFMKDANLWTELSGIQIRKQLIWKGDNKNIYATSIAGAEAEAQRIFDQAAQPKQGRGNYEWLTYLVIKSPNFGYLGLYRYGFGLGREKLFKAADVFCPVTSQFNTRFQNLKLVTGITGAKQRYCDHEALKYVRKCLEINVRGIRIAPDPIRL